MVESQNESYPGDLSATPTPSTEAQFVDEEGPSVSHEVIASYVADAARSVRGIVDLHTSPWKGFSSRVREIHSGGVAIRDAEAGTVHVDIHVRVAWGTVIPELAHQVDAAVRERVTALLNISVGTVTLFVDEIAGPMEVGTTRES